MSQINRSVESRENKRPSLGDLRESGSIEAEADIVALLYRDGYYKQQESAGISVEPAEIIVAKHRNGPTGVITVGFQPGCTRYRNLKGA